MKYRPAPITKTIFIFISLMLIGAAGEFDQCHKVQRFDEYFRNYSKRYFGSNFDWRCFKAQAIIESRLNQKARSRDGSIGIMQIQPATFKKIRRMNPDIDADLWHPRWNIAAAVSYNRMLWETWRSPRSQPDRIRFMLGSYNAGLKSMKHPHEVSRS